MGRDDIGNLAARRTMVQSFAEDARESCRYLRNKNALRRILMRRVSPSSSPVKNANSAREMRWERGV
jgi:hypothetical protein